MTPLTGHEREALLRQLLLRLYRHEITEGALLGQLRKKVLGLTQEEYARLVGISRRTLSEIERDKGQPTMSVYRAVFKPLGLRPGLLPRSESMLKSVLRVGD